MRGVIDNVVQSIDDMLVRAGQKVESYPEMKRALHELAQIRDMAGYLVAPSAGEIAVSMSGGSLPPGGQTLLTGGGARGEDALSRLLAELCGHLGCVDGKHRSKLISDSLHLIAEMLLAGAADPALIERYRAQLAGVLDDLEEYHLDRSQASLLRRLIDTKNLGRDLRGEP
ncbi:MAG: hypothetical protein HC897_03330 [Thermoanaerobaculia bacterium]|nr:hypothetical protein [Thermoanaerobaculia bacterium]